MEGFNWAGFLSTVRDDVERVSNAKGNMKILHRALTEGFTGMKPISKKRIDVLVERIEAFVKEAHGLELVLTAFSADLDCREAGIAPEGDEG